MYLTKIKRILRILREADKLEVVRNSRDISRHMVITVLQNGPKVLAEVKSRSSDGVHQVFIDFSRDVYVCTCNSWTFKRYEITIPPKYRKYFMKRTIALCPHIIAVFEKLIGQNIYRLILF